MPKEPITVDVTVQAVETVEVVLVELRGQSAVVQRDLVRRIVPAAELADGAVPLETWEMGVPYGVPWESILTLSATAQQLADELRRNGIWTFADLERNQAAAFGAIQAVYGLDLAKLIQAAHGYKEAK